MEPPQETKATKHNTVVINNHLSEKIRLAGILPLRYRCNTDPGKPDFFRLSFCNCISCVNNCEDLLYIYFFIPQFKYMNFIYS